ncbi:MAG: molybdenum ABC transporter ATP-binding protein [Limimaricola sp.]|uniref:molybdenum ABC transporter ATP-binding protein n=1 Tax=Limimaricola sp. TaxID=2211665 RepID=UPI001E13B3D9|nr:molybdenum ABC transporter ATP-binding protein [Limimaricola sp.]MBI1418974.1 molybdenum ABC transporter ATP-binding protein [Limimaricola sp.]
MSLSVDIGHRAGAFSIEATFEAPGGVTALFGRSGAGKTTVVNAVAGLVRPQRGRIALGDRVLFEAGRTNLPPQRRRIGYVFQEPRLFPHMSVLANLRYGGTHDEARVIDLLGIGALLERRPGTLSGGEAARVALGRALMSAPEMLLLDEPLAALDAPRRAEVLGHLERLRDEVGIPMLYVSHELAEVARLATTLVLLDSGRVLRAGPLAQVLADPAAAHLFGDRGAGAVISARVVGHDSGDDLTEVDFDGGRLLLPGRVGRPGARLTVRIAAEDVILAGVAPLGLSALNVLEVEVTALADVPGGVAVGLSVGRAQLLARVTRRSAVKLDLRPGARVFAVVKATAMAPGDPGTAAGAPARDGS